MIKNYIKISLRVLSKNKTYASLNIVGLSLGLTGSILIFLFVWFHLSTDAFHQNAARIYRLVLDIRVEDGSVEYEPGTSVAMLNALREDYAQVERTAMCMFFYTPPTLAVPTTANHWERYVEPQGVAYGNTDLLYMFDFTWLVGDKQTALNEPRQVILSESQAIKYFGSIDVLGKTIRINQQTDLVVSGVIATPPAHTDLSVDVLISLPTLKILNPAYQLDNYAWFGHNNWLFVQLQAGAEAKQLDQQLAGFVQKYLGENFSHWQLHLQPLSAMHFDEKYSGVISKTLLYTLGLTGIVLLLVACLNFINLSTAQASQRAKEVGVRKVMGSTRKQIFWQFIVETALITLLAVLLASVVIPLLLPLLNNWLQTALSLSLLAAPAILTFLLILILLLILLAGSYPAMILSGFQPVAVLKNQVMVTGHRKFSIRKILVVVQFVFSQIFAVSALVIMYQMNYLQHASMGFNTEATVTISLPKTTQSRLETLRHELKQHLDIAEVSFHHRPPMTDSNDGGYIKLDQQENWEPFMVRDRWADAHYLTTYELQLVAGRNIQEHDSAVEFLVNEAFIRRLNLDKPEEILDRKIYDGNAEIGGTIVGVVRDFHHRPLQHAIEPVVIYAYPRLFRQAGIRFRTQHIAQVLQTIQTIWTKTFPDDVFEYAFVDDTIARMYHQEKTISHLSKIFTIATLLICFLGLYGLVLFVTVQRTKEIGIRKVLGASMGNILLLLSKGYIKLMLIAFVLAIPIANYFITEWLQRFAYRIEISWWLFAVPGVLVLFIALLSVSGQTLKAARRNPVDSLRNE